MYGSAQPEEQLPAGGTENTAAPVDRAVASAIPAGAINDRFQGGRALDETELDSALQLLVERAQYITGATGTALALPQGEEMVCRASAGSSAPAVGASLQVRSGLTGESIARRQLLRCDNAETDPRVNLEACRALGIASIVVLPLLRRNGEVRGLFELFSDHPYAFEERDLIALERMAALTSTALDLAEQREKSGAPPPRKQDGLDSQDKHDLRKAADSRAPHPVASGAPTTAAHDATTPVGIPPHIPVHAAVSGLGTLMPPSPLAPSAKEPPELEFPPAEPPAIPPQPPVRDPVPEPEPTPGPKPTPPPIEMAAPAAIPEAMLRVKKCASCGFPVSEARTLCLDCERLDRERLGRERKEREKKASEDKRQAQDSAKPQPIETQTGEQELKQGEAQDAPSGAAPTEDALAPAQQREDFLPAFLANSQPVDESWLANPVNLLAFLVLIVGILVAVVVFR
jgi:putative methionine-R-sulfoxide reductase with GAF domain